MAMSAKTTSVLLWIVFFGFAAIAIGANWDPRLLDFGSKTGVVRLLLGVVWIGFLAYSIFSSSRESLFRTVRVMGNLYWGRQIGIDLYISVFLSIGVVYLVTGSLLATILWGLAFVPFANLAILLFVILHLDIIIGMLGPSL